jgi:hypothetical protein
MDGIDGMECKIGHVSIPSKACVVARFEGRGHVLLTVQVLLCLICCLFLCRLFNIVSTMRHPSCCSSCVVGPVIAISGDSAEAAEAFAGAATVAAFW